MKKIRILLIDCDDIRRNHLFVLLNRYESCFVDQKSTISKDEFEQGNYEVVLVHFGNNPEGGCIENQDWDAGRAKVILFSGGFVQDKSDYDGMLYASASYIEDKENLYKMLDEVIAQ